MNRKRIIVGASALVILSTLYGSAAYGATKTWDSEPGGHTSTFGFSGANHAITEKTTGAKAYFEDTNLEYTSTGQQWQLQVKTAAGYFQSEGNLTESTGSTGTWSNRQAGEYLIQLNGFDTGSVGWVYDSGYDWALNATTVYTY